MELFTRRIALSKRIARMISTVLVTFIFCCLTTGVVSAGTKSPTEITIVLDWTINTNHTGIYAALEQEYFEDEGLKANIEFPPEIGAESLVFSGVAQFGVSYQESVTMSRAKGVKLKALAAILQHNTSGFAARKTEGIYRPRDFEGKTYGGWGSPIEEATLKALMEKDNGDYSKIKQVAIGSMDFFAATSGSIDFTWIYYGWDGVAAEVKGIDITYIPMGEIEPALDYYTPLIITSEKYIKKNPETIRRFLKAVSRGYEFCMNNPAKAAEILLKYAPELDRDLVLASQKYLAGQYQAEAPRWGEMKLSKWAGYANWLKKYDQLEGKFDPKTAFTNEFLPE